VVQSSPASGADRLSPSERGRSALLSSTYRADQPGLTRTNGPPKYPGRFRWVRTATAPWRRQAVRGLCRRRGTVVQSLERTRRHGRQLDLKVFRQQGRRIRFISPTLSRPRIRALGRPQVGYPLTTRQQALFSAPERPQITLARRSAPSSTSANISTRWCILARQRDRQGAASRMWP